jgi:hypothetical protein
MRLRHSIILFAVLAAAFLPRMARAQDVEYCSNYVCESDAVYDPNSGEISGYARTVDYGEFGETGLRADATLGDSNGNTVAYDTDMSFGEADAYVWWAVGEAYGQYGIRGDHYYIIEDDYLEGGDFLQSTYWSVDASGPPANITNITWSPADSAWQAGYSYTFTVTGTGFGSNPIVTIMGPDDTYYYNASCTQGTQCDTYISGTVSIPSTAPSGYALVIVTPVGFSGLGFGQNPPSPPPVTGEVPVTGGVQCPTEIGVSDTTSLRLPYPGLLTGIGIVANMSVSPGANGAELQELVNASENDCPTNFATCSGSSNPFIVGAGGEEEEIQWTGPAQSNIFYDIHAFTSPISVLDAAGITSCTMTCIQAYTCSGTQVGRTFTIYRTLTKGTIDGQNVTNVDVTKY